MRHVALLLAALAVAALGSVAPAGRAYAPHGTVETVSFESHALARTARFAVYLPPGYSSGQLAYPVIYFLHGLPASPSEYRTESLRLATALDPLGLEALVVVPQAAASGDSDPEYLDWGPGRDWEQALAVELPAYVDAHFRTIPDRTGRAVAGVSAGGYGATLLGLHHLGTFSVIESWSGYFEPTDPGGEHVLDLGSASSNAQADARRLFQALAARLAAEPTFVGFYAGEADWRFRDDNVQLDAELTSLGIAHDFALYPGGHSWALWSAHADDWLGLAVSHLDAPVAALRIAS